MPNSNHPLHFETVIVQLNQWRDATIAELPNPRRTKMRSNANANSITQSRVWNFARHQMRPNCQMTVLPPTLVRTPSSEYRIMEDNESDNRAWWTELEIDEQPFRPDEGDMVLSDAG